MPRYESRDFVKVEFDSETKSQPTEWMWVRVHHCEDARQLVFGTLDNEPVVSSEQLQLGQELAISTARSASTGNPPKYAFSSSGK